MSRLLAPSSAATSSLSLSWMASPSLFWVCWMRNTIRNVTIVVPVLITSCQVSEKPKMGPVMAQTRMMPRASAKAGTLPVKRVAAEAKRSKTRAWAFVVMSHDPPRLGSIVTRPLRPGHDGTAI